MRAVDGSVDRGSFYRHREDSLWMIGFLRSTVYILGFEQEQGTEFTGRY